MMIYLVKGMEEGSYSLEPVAIWSVLAFFVLVMKGAFALLSGGLSQVNEAITPSTNLDFLLIGAAIPYILHLTVGSIWAAIMDDDEANDESE